MRPLKIKFYCQILKKVIFYILILEHSKNLSGKKFICNCGQSINIENLIEEIFDKNSLQKFQKDVNIRLQSYCQRFCMNNLESLRSKNDIRLNQNYGFENGNDYEKLIRIPGTYLNCGFDHLLCKQCSKQINEDIYKKFEKNENIEIKCNICNDKHVMQRKVWNSLLKIKDDGGCCYIF